MACALWNSMVDLVNGYLTLDITSGVWQDIYTIVKSISGFCVAAGEAFCCIMFIIGLVKGFEQAPEMRVILVIKPLARFILAFAAVHYSMDIMMWFWKVGIGIITGINGKAGYVTSQLLIDSSSYSGLQDYFSNSANGWDFLFNMGEVIIDLILGVIPGLVMLLVTVMGLAIVGSALYIYLTARILKVMATMAIAPLGICCFAGEATSHIGFQYLKSFAGDCVSGALIAVIMIIFSIFMETDIWDGVDFGVGTAGLDMWVMLLQLLIKVILFAVLVIGSRSLIKEKFGM